MSAKFQITDCKSAPEAVGPYSQVAYSNNTYYFSGQLGIDPSNSKLKDTLAEQAQQILDNVDELLKELTLERSSIIKTTIYLSDLGYFDTINNMYKDYFELPFPARSCIEVSALPKGAKIEIDIIAIK